jgi:predicted metal-binding membrane protein
MNSKNTLARFASKFRSFPAGSDIVTLPAGFIAVCAVAFLGGVLATIYFCRSMAGGMKMPGGWTMSMMWMPMPDRTPAISAVMFLLMWLAMMVAMMLPSAMPMLLNLRRSSAGNGNFEARALFATAGYFSIWTFIGVVVYALGVAFANAAMRLYWLSCLTPALSGTILVIAGVIQFTPWKMSALRRCRSADCGTTFACGTLKGSWSYGLKQGVTCGICCAAPMLALLVLGAMNLTLMAIITVVITVEKLLPRPEATVRLFGAVALLLGLGILVQRVFLHF